MKRVLKITKLTGRNKTHKKSKCKHPDNKKPRLVKLMNTAECPAIPITGTIILHKANSRIIRYNKAVRCNRNKELRGKPSKHPQTVSQISTEESPVTRTTGTIIHDEIWMKMVRFNKAVRCSKAAPYNKVALFNRNKMPQPMVNRMSTEECPAMSTTGTIILRSIGSLEKLISANSIIFNGGV